MSINFGTQTAISLELYMALMRVQTTKTTINSKVCILTYAFMSNPGK